MSRDPNEQKRQSKSVQREQQKPEQRAARRRSRAGGASEPADYGSIDPQLLAGVIRAVTYAGAAVQFGYTRDGGSYAIRIVGDGAEPYTEFIRPSEDVGLYLNGIIEDFVG